MHTHIHTHTYTHAQSLMTTLYIYTHTHIHTYTDSDDHMVVGRGGPLFRVGSIHSESDSTGGGTYGDPNSFAWCLMNLCISKLIMFAVRKVLLTAGVEVLGMPAATCKTFCVVFFTGTIGRVP